MDNTANAELTTYEHLVLATTSGGTELRGSLVHLTRFEAAFEVYGPSAVLRMSEVLGDLRIVVNDHPIYSGRAVVHSVVHTAGVSVCQVQLEDGWIDGELLAWRNDRGNLKGAFHNFLHGWEKVYKVRSDFKCAVADLQAFLTHLRLWLEQLELSIRSQPAADRLKLEQDAAGEVGQMTTPAITSLFEVFQEAAARVPEEHLPMHRSFCRKQLHPLLLCSPFLYRTYFKPLGFAGDYEMVNMIMREPYEGGSLFAKIVNLWFLKQAPAEAHRNRITHLADQISNTILQAKSRGGVPRILSLGCGPAHELQQLLREGRLAHEFKVTLIDFNDETLTHVQDRLGQLQTQFPGRIEFRPVKKSVNTILKEAGRTTSRSPESQYDLVYCAGLSDYLTDAICRRLNQVLYDWVAPGGRLLTTNVDPSNPRQLIMDLVMEWHLIHRSGAQMAALKPEQVHADQYSVRSDTTGVNVYLEAWKPR